MHQTDEKTTKRIHQCVKDCKALLTGAGAETIIISAGTSTSIDVTCLVGQEPSVLTSIYSLVEALAASTPKSSTADYLNMMQEAGHCKQKLSLPRRKGSPLNDIGDLSEEQKESLKQTLAEHDGDVLKAALEVAKGASFNTEVLPTPIPISDTKAQTLLKEVGRPFLEKGVDNFAIVAQIDGVDYQSLMHGESHQILKLLVHQLANLLSQCIVPGKLNHLLERLTPILEEMVKDMQAEKESGTKI